MKHQLKKSWHNVQGGKDFSYLLNNLVLVLEDLGVNSVGFLGLPLHTLQTLARPSTRLVNGLELGRRLQRWCLVYEAQILQHLINSTFKGESCR